MSLIQWLKKQLEYPKFYWAARDGSRAMAGVGIKHESSSPIEGSFGLLRFDNQKPSSKLWEPFGQSRFVVPKKMTRQNVMPAKAGIHESALSCQRRLASSIGRDKFWIPASAGMTNNPSLRWNDSDSFWHNLVTQVLQEIRSGTFKKVVLAKQFTYKLHEETSALDLLERLQASIPNAYYFLFAPNPNLAFLGASPEKLYKRSGKKIFSEAQAGTKPVQANPKELLENPKEILEHQIVIEHILSCLKSLCIDYGIKTPTQIVKLPQVQHLRTSLAGILKTGQTDKNILATLHPTAAIGGLPSYQALRFIRNSERLDRGFYAGAIGYIEHDEAEFAVAIRSAVMQDSFLHLFGGAGVVEGSNPEQELQEIENKIAFWSQI